MKNLIASAFAAALSLAAMPALADAGDNSVRDSVYQLATGRQATAPVERPARTIDQDNLVHAETLAFVEAQPRLRAIRPATPVASETGFAQNSH